MYIDWKILVGYLSVPSTVAFATGLSIAYFQDPIIVLSIYFSSISIGLAIAIFAIQNSQGAKIQEITDKIKEVTDKTQKEKEKKYDVAMGLIVDSVKDLKVLLPEREKEQKNWPQQSGPKHDESYKKIQINFMHLQNDQKELHHSRDLYGDVITTNQIQSLKTSINELDEYLKDTYSRPQIVLPIKSLLTTLDSLGQACTLLENPYKKSV